MSTINLIPPQVKIAERNRKIFGLVYSIMAILLVMVIFCYGAVFALNYFTKEELDKTKETLAEEQARLKNLEEIKTEVNGINARLKKISDYQKERLLWSTVLADLNHSAPEQLKIDTYAVNTKDKKITLGGAAETRRDIVKLQQKLGILSYYTNLNFNSSTYTDTEGMYTFTMSGELKKWAKTTAKC